MGLGTVHQGKDTDVHGSQGGGPSRRAEKPCGSPVGTQLLWGLFGFLGSEKSARLLPGAPAVLADGVGHPDFSRMRCGQCSQSRSHMLPFPFLSLLDV